MNQEFKFNNSILVKPEDLNPVGKLFGGRILQHIDEKAAIFCKCQMNYSGIIVTKLMSEINFVSSGDNGDVIEFGFRTIAVGRSSITIECVVQNKVTGNIIIKIDKIVFVNVNATTLKSEPHGFTKETIGTK
jgi:acyl-CoA hydrolase